MTFSVSDCCLMLVRTEFRIDIFSWHTQVISREILQVSGAFMALYDGCFVTEKMMLGRNR